MVIAAYRNAAHARRAGRASSSALTQRVPRLRIAPRGQVTARGKRPCLKPGLGRFSRRAVAPAPDLRGGCRPRGEHAHRGGVAEAPRCIHASIGTSRAGLRVQRPDQAECDQHARHDVAEESSAACPPSGRPFQRHGIERRYGANTGDGDRPCCSSTTGFLSRASPSSAPAAAYGGAGVSAAPRSRVPLAAKVSTAMTNTHTAHFAPSATRPAISSRYASMNRFRSLVCIGRPIIR